VNSRENYVQQDLAAHFPADGNSRVAAQGPLHHATDGGQRANMLTNLSKHNRGSSVTPSIPNLTNDLGVIAL